MLCECRILTGPDWYPTLRGRLAYARDTVKVSMFLFSPNWYDQHLNILRDFQAVAQRGLQCRIILSAHPMKVGKRRPNADTAAKLEAAGWEVRIIAGRHALHEKIIVIDDTATFIGSHNLAYSSATTNYDTSVLLEGPEAADQATRQFWERWKLAETATSQGWEVRRPLPLPFTP